MPARKKTAETPAASPAKPAFNEFVEAERKAKRDTLKTVAQSIAVPHDTLRTWLHRNAFPDTVAVALAKHFGRGTDLKTLQDEFEFDLVIRRERGGLPPAETAPQTLAGALAYHDQRGERLIHRLDTDFTWHIENLMRGMADGDLFALYTWDKLPFEFGVNAWGSIGRLVADAVGRGAFFAYLWPDAELAKFLREAGFRPLVPEDFERGFRDFQGVIGDLLGERHAAVKDHLFGIPVTKFGYTVPGTKYCIYRAAARSRASQYPARAFAHYPTGSAATQFHINMTLDADATGDLLRFFREAMSGHRALRDVFLGKC